MMSATQAQSPQTMRLYPGRFAVWQRHGLSARAASAVSLAGCDTVEEIALLGRAYFERLPNCAEKTLTELAKLASWPPKRRTAVDAIAQALELAISNPEEAREAAADVMASLRKAGFILTTTNGAAAPA